MHLNYLKITTRLPLMLTVYPDRTPPMSQVQYRRVASHERPAPGACAQQARPVDVLTCAAPNTLAQSSAVEHCRKLRVLLVDVAQVHHDLIDADPALFKPFVTMDQASSLALAIKKLSINTYHAVVSEWRRPEDACAPLVRWMRSQERLHRVALIVIAALNQRQDLQQALAAAPFEPVLTDTLSTEHFLIDAFLVTPFRRQDLFNAVTSAVEKRRLRRPIRL